MTETQKIPLFPLGVVVLPDMSFPLHIFEERYKLMISECIAQDMPFGIVLFDGQYLHTAGCMVRVMEVTRRYEDGRMDIMTRGQQRFVIQKVITEKPYMEAYVDFFEDDDTTRLDDLQPLVEKARDLLKELSNLDQLVEDISLLAQSSPLKLSFAIAALEGFTAAERQRFLEMTSTAERIKKGVEALSRLVQRSRLTNEIRDIIGGNGNPPKQLIELLSPKIQDRS
ncbi:MAG: LON peptidase substrate-binding domain-containing protein [Desulfobacterales bacterium]